MEIILIVVAFLFLLVGLLGSFVPALPGPPLSFAGLLLIQWSGRGNFSMLFLIVWAVITIAIMLIDNFLPAWMTKKFGGSKLAVAGSVAGLIIGMIFFAPLGILAGPFLGALAGELLNNRIQSRKNNAALSETGDQIAADSAVIKKPGALKVAFGAFLAFILGTGAKLLIGSMMIYYAVTAVF